MCTLPQSYTIFLNNQSKLWSKSINVYSSTIVWESFLFQCNSLHVLASHLATGPNMTDAEYCTTVFHQKKKEASFIWGLIRAPLTLSQHEPRTESTGQHNSHLVTALLKNKLWINSELLPMFLIALLPEWTTISQLTLFMLFCGGTMSSESLSAISVRCAYLTTRCQWNAEH